MTIAFKLVSADSHVAEPADLWTTRLDRQFRDRAPHLVSNEDGDAYVIPGVSESGSLVGLTATKEKYTNPDARFGVNGRWADVPEGAYDPVARAAELDRESIEAEILYPTIGLSLFGIRDSELRRACFTAFNDWLAEHCAGARTRLFGVAMITTDDIDRGVAELERCVGMGLPGAMISIGQQSGESYGDARFEKFWSAAEGLGVPVSLHVAATETSWQNTGSMFVDFACVFTPTMYAVTSMIFSGLFDRHPKLKVLSVENDASWPLAVLERMDDRWIHDRLWAPVMGQRGAAITSGRTPSQIFHDHVACTFMRDRTAIVSREIIGRQNLMWGADFPHFDGAWPHSARILERQFDGVPLEDQVAIGRNNAIKWYNLPLEPASVSPETAAAAV
jgi:predicted TIM-barrel fold metal-dependent hydrolase